MGDWLGTEVIANQNKEFWPYERASKFIKLQKLKNLKEWREFSSSGKRPINLPSQPEVKYKDKGWKGWPDFLGYD
jgi:hypothetical protein